MCKMYGKTAQRKNNWKIEIYCYKGLIYEVKSGCDKYTNFRVNLRVKLRGINLKQLDNRQKKQP